MCSCVCERLSALLLFVSFVCSRLCLPSLWLLCVLFLVCSAVSVFVVFSGAVSCVLMDFRLPS